MIFKVKHHIMKKKVSLLCNHSYKIWSGLNVKQGRYLRKNLFLKTKVPFVTFEVILNFIKNLHLHNVSIHTNFYQNRFINEYDRKKKAKIWESRNHGVF